jgi:hypothetical protein
MFRGCERIDFLLDGEFTTFFGPFVYLRFGRRSRRGRFWLWFWFWRRFRFRLWIAALKRILPRHEVAERFLNFCYRRFDLFVCHLPSLLGMQIAAEVFVRMLGYVLRLALH